MKKFWDSKLGMWRVVDEDGETVALLPASEAVEASSKPDNGFVPAGQGLLRPLKLGAVWGRREVVL